MLAWGLLIARALAAPLTLPAGEDTAAWAAALSHAGVEADVRIVETSVGWTLTVHVGSASRTVAVSPARSADDREELALLAASLAREVQTPALPSLPALPALPSLPTLPELTSPAEIEAQAVTPAPAPAPGASAEDELEETVAIVHDELLPVLLGAAPGVVVRPRSAPPSPPPPSTAESNGLRPTLSAGPALTLRGRVRTAASMQLWTGVAARWWRVGIGAEVSAPALLPIDDDSRMQSTDGVVAAWLTPAWFEVGAVAALSTRGFTEAESALERGTWWWVGAETGVHLPVGRGRVRVAARLARDLADTELIVDEVRLRVLDPWHGGLSLRFGLGAP